MRQDPVTCLQQVVMSERNSNSQHIDKYQDKPGSGGHVVNLWRPHVSIERVGRHGNEEDPHNI